MPTAFGADGTAVRVSRTAGLPMPPPIPGRAYRPTFNGNGQYRLPHPETGKLTSYTRASTIAKTLEDTWMLDSWAKRMMLLGLVDDAHFLRSADERITAALAKAGLSWAYPSTTIARELRGPLNDLAEQAQVNAGSLVAAEFGTVTHAWCEWVDHGLGALGDVPELFQPWVRAHRQILAREGLTPDPTWTERIVLNTQYGIAGTLDRLFWNHQGDLFLGDIKTSRGMEYSWLYFAIQLAIYHSASHVLNLEGTAWEPMPPVQPDVALVAHLPREEPEASKIVPISMVFGAQALHAAMTVRRLRSTAEKGAQSVSYGVDSMTDEQQRFYSARFAVETSQTQSELAAHWEIYQDVWTDELTEIGRRSLRPANANASA